MTINSVGVHLQRRDFGRPLQACAFGFLSLGFLIFSILQLPPNVALAAIAAWAAVIWGGDLLCLGPIRTCSDGLVVPISLLLLFFLFS